MKLLIDLGNTRFKWCLSEATELSPMQAQSYSGMDIRSQLQVALDDLEDKAIEQILVSSVVNTEVAEVVAATLADLDLAPVQFVRCEKNWQGTRFVYEDMSQMGVDRWLGLIAARRLTRQACCVVSCGTATTLDVMLADGRHLGGLIMPGVDMMIDSLVRGTGQIKNGEGQLVELASNTADAVYTGCYRLTAKGLEALLLQYTQQHHSPMQYIMTGGQAEQIAGLISLPIQVRQELVMQGLQILAEEP